jgi:hypothetical protein
MARNDSISMMRAGHRQSIRRLTASSILTMRRQLDAQTDKGVMRDGAADFTIHLLQDLTSPH